MGSPGTSPFGLRGERVRRTDPPVNIQPGVIGNAPQNLSRVHPPIVLSIETGLRTDEFAPAERIDWDRISFAMDGQDTTATLSAGLDADRLGPSGELGQEHFTHLLDLLTPDRRIRIAQQFGTVKQEVYFQGYAMTPQIQWSDRGQSLTCLCVHEGQEILRHESKAQVMGRYMRFAPLQEWEPDAPDALPVFTLPCVFNAGGRPNRSEFAHAFEVDGFRYLIHLFVGDGAPEAKFWSFGQALRYLAMLYILRPGLGVQVTDLLKDTNPFISMGPSPRSEDPFVRRLSAECQDVACESMNVEEAIFQLTDEAGAHYEIETENVGDAIGVEVEHRVRVFATLADDDEALADPDRRMRMARVHDTPREAPFTDQSDRSPLDTALTNRAVQCNLTYDRRAINHPIFRAGPKEYEVTLLLRPGWKPHLQLDNLDTEEKQQAAITFWELEFAPELDDPDSGLPHSIYHGQHPDREQVNDVGRLWIFPDDHRHLSVELSVDEETGEETSEVTSPFARDEELPGTIWTTKLYSPYDVEGGSGLVLVRHDIGGGIADADVWVPRRRPFRDTIGRILGSSSRPPIVRVNFKATDPNTALERTDWITYRGKVLIDPHRAALWFKDDNIWNSLPVLTVVDDPEALGMLAAYIGQQPDGSFDAPHFMVSVTCVIRGDFRLVQRSTTTGASFWRRRHQIVELGTERFQSRNRTDQNSHLNRFVSSETDPQYLSRDDTERLKEFADREGKLAVGDRVSGLGLTFNRFPEVVRREFARDSNAGYRTTLHLSDLRDAPEVGAE